MMKQILTIWAILMTLMLACQPDQKAQQAGTSAGIHKVTVMEVLQTNNYTYLRVKENDGEQWLAVKKMTANPGEIYYHRGGMLMTEFKSKELDRIFKSILFLEKVDSSPDFSEKSIASPHTSHAENPHGSMQTHEAGQGKPAVEKKEIKVNPAENGITIAALFKNKIAFNEKTVIIKGEVTKFTPDIMNKNWIHIQDGTDASGKFDLTVTSDTEVKVGEIVTLEGKISLDKDFGFGYVYEVLMEEAKVIKR